MTTAPSNPSTLDIRAGDLCVTLASSADEVRAAQRLRHRYFSGHDNPDPQGIDSDAFDAHCDHLLVKDLGKSTLEEQVVGTYRMIRRPAMEAVGRFYSESEFALAKIKAFDGNLLELGRSCVKEEYRNRAVMQLLWRGIGAYVAQHDIGLMFGCASFHGIDVQEHRVALSYLHHYHMAPEHLRASAIGAHRIELDILPKEQIDPKRAFVEVPPLIKGYLRLGGFIGDGGYVDHECRTIDVCIVVVVDEVSDKYFQRYGQAAEASPNDAEMAGE